MAHCCLDTRLWIFFWLEYEVWDTKLLFRYIFWGRPGTVGGHLRASQRPHGRSAQWFESFLPLVSWKTLPFCYVMLLLKLAGYVEHFAILFVMQWFHRDVFKGQKNSLRCWRWFVMWNWLVAGDCKNMARTSSVQNWWRKKTFPVQLELGPGEHTLGLLHGKRGHLLCREKCRICWLR